MLAETNMRVGLVCGPVGKINQRERDFTLNGRYQAHSLDIACACKQLAVEAEDACYLRQICVLGWCAARLARSIGGRGISP